MSDPFERLSAASFDATPDLDAIRLRAHRIQRRRQVGIASAGASALAILAVVGVLLTTQGTDKPTQLAEDVRTTATPRELAARSAPLKGVAESQTESAAKAGGQTAGGSAVVSQPNADSATAGSGAAVPAQAGPPMEELKATLEIEEQTLGRGQTFTLKVCNQTSGAVKREFGSSQRYDFEVKRDGELVWRWSDGMFFTQVVGEENWKAKECKTWSEDWNATNSEGMPVSSGDYEAVGIMKASDELKTSPKKFSVAAI